MESLEDKPLDPHLALEKVLKLDRKHMNFDFYDSTRNVQFRIQNPSILNDMPPTQHLLRHFWKQTQNHYFRTPHDYEIDRLHYLSSILEEELSYDQPFTPSQEFWNQLQLVFTTDFVRKQTSLLKDNIDSENWLCSLFLHHQILENEEELAPKKLKRKLQDLTHARSKIQNVNNRRFQHSLYQQNQYLKNLLPSINQNEDQVQAEIRALGVELSLYHERTFSLFEQLKQRLSLEQRKGESLFCFGDEEYGLEDQKEICFEEILEKKINDTDIQLQYYSYIINNLEKKQVAESMSKVVKLERPRGEAKFVVTFEKGMNLNKKSIEQKQFLKLNNYRQYSLFKFYNTSLKTPFSFICQNYLGFRDIYFNRNQPCKLKDKSIILEMKKFNSEPEQLQKQFDEFQICHHCKLLYPEQFLIKCKYNSQKLGIPSQPVTYCDPYLAQITKSKSLTNLVDISHSARFSNRKRNCYQNYTKVGTQFVCDRMFCKFCIKNTYGGSFDKNGLCPFCQGVCFCTRCTRNQMIIRLKGIYLLLGGRVPEVEVDGFYQFKTEEESNLLQNRKKEKHKKNVKKPIGNPACKSFDHINNIRVQLEPLRLLSDLVKKRQKNKYRLLEAEQDIFLQKLTFLSKDFNFGLKKISSDNDNTMQSEYQGEVKSLSHQRGRPRKI